MATFTPNYNLKKPATSDLVNIADLNGNMDTLDTQLKLLSDSIKPTRSIRKPSDTARNNNTKSDDPHLVMAVTAGKKYVFEAVIHLTLPSGGGGSSIQIKDPGGGSVILVKYMVENAGSSNTQGSFVNAFTQVIDTTAPGSTFTQRFYFIGIIEANGSGNTGFSWAEFSNSATATTMLTNSYFKLTEI